VEAVIRTVEEDMGRGLNGGMTVWAVGRKYWIYGVFEGSGVVLTEGGTD